MRRTPVLIVGGGPAGSAAAIALGARGIEADLVERNLVAHAVCGGFLGWDALAALRRLGIEPERLGARPITRLRIFAGSRCVEARLPAQAAGLSRLTLDEALLAATGKAGARIKRGQKVRSVAAGPEGWTARLDDSETLAAAILIAATGKYVLRGVARTHAPEGSVGFQARIEPTPALAAALAGTIELHLFDGGYAGLLVQEDGSVNLAVSVEAALIGKAGSPARMMEMAGGMAPMLAARLALGKPGPWSSVAGVPYGWRAREGENGLYRVGDQAAVIASLAGDGIAIALASGISAAEAIAGGVGADAWQRAFARRARRPVAVAEAVRRAAGIGMTRTPAMALAGASPFLAGLIARATRIGG